MVAVAALNPRRVQHGAGQISYITEAGLLRFWGLDTLSSPEQVLEPGFFNCVTGLYSGSFVWVSARDEDGNRVPMALHVMVGSEVRHQSGGKADVEVEHLRFLGEAGISKAEAASLVNRLERAAEAAEAALAKLESADAQEALARVEKNRPKK